MKNIKEVIIGVFAVIGFAVIATGFTNETSDPQYPESHVWEVVVAERQGADDRVYMYNKITGEMRKYSSKGMSNGKLKDQYYQVMNENKEGEK